MTSGSKKTKQHITPAFYLSFFSAEGYRKPHVWIDDKTSKKDPFCDAVDNVGYEKNVYTIENADNPYVWDDFYTDLEPDMATLFRKTIQEVSNMVVSDKKKVIDEQSKKKLSAYIAVQIARGKRYLEFPESKIEEIRELPRALGLDIDIDFPQKDDLAHLATNRQLLNLYMLYLHNRSWIFYYASTDSFITSDEPVMFFDAYSDKEGLFKCGIADKNTIVCIPFNPRILLVMYHPFFNSGKANYCDRQRIMLDKNDIIEKHNQGQTTQSNRFIYGNSKEIVQQYACNNQKQNPM